MAPHLNPTNNHLQSLRLCVSSGFSTHEDGTDRLSRNVGKKVPLLAA
jgi:hypothetical protein